MKLFGSKKGGKHNVIAADHIASEDIQEVQVPAQEPEVPAVPAAPADADVPVITVFAQQAAQEEVPAEQPAENQEDGLISSIAEAVGVTAELKSEEPAVVQEEVLAEVPVVEVEEPPKKPTRAEKKAAKKEAKAAKKAEEIAAKKAKKEAKKWSTGKKVLVSLVLVFALLLTGGAGYVVSQLWQTEKDLGIYSPDFVEPERDDGDTVDPDINNTDESNDGKDATPVDSSRKEGCYTFLVAGRDNDSGCTDVIIVGRLDTVNGTIDMVSIPRDTLINKGLLKVNTAYQGNLADGGNGIDGLLKEIKKIVGFDIDSWAVVDIDAVEKLIDAIGGVYYDVPMDINWTSSGGKLVIKLKKGYQLLNGEDAVKLLRYRKGYANGDLGRIETQHDFLLAMADQILDVKNIPNMTAAIKIYQECVHSNLSAGNLVFYAKEFLKLESENIQFHDMPQMMGGIVNNQSFIFINPTKWLNVINEYLNPYKEDITAKNLSIKTSADQGKSFYYTAGAN